ncbi:hypothetical protein QFZ31_000830 [Neobacillus niacini]|uniref:hypothetical protein n=1 Tax=Neobacillus driksii TaxID=3035913 RepID=UPI00277E2324|nr:hypothetical protein [Neobacillus niacini]MDQ0970952.1 hypothetical protein [Neobacillus niacini]
MFNEYTVYSLMKLRKEETERNVQNTWKYYNNGTEINDHKEINVHSNLSIKPCCECTC